MVEELLLASRLDLGSATLSMEPLDLEPLCRQAWGRIAVTTSRKADRLHVTVSDEGPGVDQADMGRLFEPFFRIDRSRSRKTGAGGLVVAFDLPVATG